MSNDTRILRLFSVIDEYINNNFSNKTVSNWHTGPCWPADIKWQKIIDDFLIFKIYEPIEADGYIPVKNRNRVEFKFTLQHPSGRYILDSKCYSDEQHITEILNTAHKAMNNKQLIIDRHKKYVGE